MSFELLILGKHSLRGPQDSHDGLDWRIPEFDTQIAYCIDMRDISPLIFSGKAIHQEVSFDKISHKQKYASEERYQQCNLDEPGVIVKGMPNPHGLVYRMIDGNHRIHKMKDQGSLKGHFFIFDYDFIKPYIKPYEDAKRSVTKADK